MASLDEFYELEDELTAARARVAALEAEQGRLVDVIGLAMNYPQPAHVYEQMRASIDRVVSS